MKKITTLFFTCLFSLPFLADAQSSTMAADSAASGTLSGSTANWNYSNPLNHNGSSFGSTITVVCLSCRSNYLFLLDCGFNIPAGSTINGVEVRYERGGCNSGSYVNDTLFLSSGGTALGTMKAVYTPDVGATDTLGNPTDLWYSVLTPAIVNAPDFGLRINVASTGICTYGVFDARMTVYYTGPTGIQESQTSGRLTAWPNPTQGMISLNNTGTVNYEIYDVTGKIMMEGKVAAHGQINTTTLPGGTFFLKTGNQSVQKIIVEK